MQHQLSPLLSGTKVKLRAYTKADLELAIQFLNNYEVKSMMWPGIAFPFRMEDEQKWYESFSAISDGIYHFAIETIEEQEYVGGCGINNIDQKSRNATLGLFLGVDHQNKGYGTEVMQLLVDFCFLEMNLHKVKLNVFGFNERAIHCYEKIGFKTEGILKEELFRNGKYHDEYIMSLLHNEWQMRREAKFER